MRIVRSGRVFAREGRGFVPLDDSAAYVELLRLVLQEDGAPESVIHLLNLSPPAAGSPRARLDETMPRAFLSLLHLAQAIGELELTSPLQVTVSSTLQWVSRADTVEAEKALLLGPVRVIPRESSNVRCQSIDVVYPPQDDVARDRILTQLVAGSAFATGSGGRISRSGSLRSDVFARSYRGAAAIGVAPSPSRRVFDHGRARRSRADLG